VALLTVVDSDVHNTVQNVEPFGMYDFYYFRLVYLNIAYYSLYGDDCNFIVIGAHSTPDDGKVIGTMCASLVG
jgi:hypothetical protein